MVPLGLLSWIAFSFPLIFVNGAYVVSVISDPFGWGWNLFGTAHFQWHPFYPEYLGYIQVILLFIGLGLAINRAYFIGQDLYKSSNIALKSLLPIAIFSVIVTITFMFLFIG